MKNRDSCVAEGGDFQRYGGKRARARARAAKQQPLSTVGNVKS